MKFLDLTFETPAENLACDEALLDLCEEEAVETLRLWESERHFVVVGYGNSIEREVFVDECERRCIPILRRCSGGGTVVQGPGCLSYNLTLRIDDAALLLQTVTQTNRFVMERNRVALAQLLGINVSIQGHTDLAFAGPDGIWWKFSGNAQRRRRRSVIFHGTILHGFDLSMVDALLRFPSAQPGYREGRRHSDFIRNVPASSGKIRQALIEAWNPELSSPILSAGRLEGLLREHYLNDEWNLRR